MLFDAFDGLLLLAKGGKMTYFGESEFLPLRRLVKIKQLIPCSMMTAGKDSAKILDYFTRNGAPCPPDANPAEHIIDVVQGGGTTDTKDWVEIWNESEERKQALSQLDALNISSKNDSDYVEDTADFATSHWFQFKTVSKRLSIHIWRSPVRRYRDTQNDFAKADGRTGLHVEQDHSPYFRRTFQWIHLLEDWKRHFRPAVETLCDFQLHLRCPWLYQPDAAVLLA